MTGSPLASRDVNVAAAPFPAGFKRGGFSSLLSEAQEEESEEQAALSAKYQAKIAKAKADTAAKKIEAQKAEKFNEVMARGWQKSLDDVRTEEESKRATENARTETLGLVAAMALEREYKDEDFAAELDAEEAAELGKIRVEQAQAVAESERVVGSLAHNLAAEADAEAKEQEALSAEVAAQWQKAEAKGMELSEKRLAQTWKDVEVEAGQIDGGVSIMLYLPELVKFSTAVAGKGTLLVEAQASAPQLHVDLAGYSSAARKPASLRKRIDVFPAGAYAALEAADLKEDYDSSTGYLRIDVPLRRASAGSSQHSSLLLKLSRKLGIGKGEENKDDKDDACDAKHQSDARCEDKEDEEDEEEDEEAQIAKVEQEALSAKVAAQWQKAEAKGMELSEKRLAQTWKGVEVEAGQIDGGVSIMLYLPELVKFSTAVAGKGTLLVEAQASAPQLYTDLAGVKVKRKPASLRKRIDVFPAGAYAALEAADLKEDYDSSTGYLRIDVPLRRASAGSSQRSSILLRLSSKLKGRSSLEAGSKD